MHHAHIDKFAYQDSPIHRLDARVKLIVATVFTLAVLTLPRTSVSVLFCYAVGPFAVLAAGKIPLRFVFRHILFISPVIIILAVTYLFYDRHVVPVRLGPFSWQVESGMLRFGALVGKFIVTMMALIALISTTRFSLLLEAMGKLKVPVILTTQLGLLYRYIFVLIDNAGHILRARAARKLRNLGFKKEAATAVAMLGHLLAASLDSAHRTGMAMEARGFDGTWRSINKSKAQSEDYLFMAFSAIFIIGLHFFIRPVLV
jgi:cobalt/nickel transport system permease protein